MASSASPAPRSSARTPRSMFVDLRPRLRLVVGDADTLATLIADNPVQQQRIAQLRPLAQQNVTEVQATAGLRRSQRLQVVQPVVLRLGEAVMDQIRSLIVAVRADEGTVLGVRRAGSAVETQSPRSTLIGAGLATLLSAADAATVIRRSIPGRLRRAVTVLQGLADGRPDQRSGLTTRATASEELIPTGGTLSAGAVEATRATVTPPGNSSAEIGNGVEVTTSIVQQLRLPALDATIDAARAGAAGEGFTDVATEVSGLAQETALAPIPVGAKVYAAARSRAHGPTTALWHAVKLHGPVGEVDGPCELTVCGSLVRVSTEQQWPVATRGVCPACATLAH